MNVKTGVLHFETGLPHEACTHMQASPFPPFPPQTRTGVRKGGQLAFLLSSSFSSSHSESYFLFVTFVDYGLTDCLIHFVLLEKSHYKL